MSSAQAENGHKHRPSACLQNSNLGRRVPQMTGAPFVTYRFSLFPFETPEIIHQLSGFGLTGFDLVRSVSRYNSNAE